MFTVEQQNEAFAKLYERVKRANAGEYVMMSVRATLANLGYDEREQTTVINRIAESGFSYCLDHTISSKDENGRVIYPSREVCFWGMDQLFSRLQCVKTDFGLPYRDY